MRVVWRIEVCWSSFLDGEMSTLSDDDADLEELLHRCKLGGETIWDCTGQQRWDPGGLRYSLLFNAMDGSQLRWSKEQSAKRKVLNSWNTCSHHPRCLDRFHRDYQSSQRSEKGCEGSLCFLGQTPRIKETKSCWKSRGGCHRKSLAKRKRGNRKTKEKGWIDGSGGWSC